MTTEEQVFKKSNLTIDPAHLMKVNILIPFHGQYSKVSALVESIIVSTRSNPYQICLIDDASPNPDYIKDFEKYDEDRPAFTKPILTTIRSEKQLGFGGALELGFRNTEEPWIVVMHSDCLITSSSWLIEMCKTMQRLKNQNVKLVSARTNNPGINEPAYLTASSKISSSDGDKILEDGYIPLFCSLFHRELFSRIGGFIKNYPYAYYEDEELAFRMKKAKFKQAISGKSWVYHEGGCTINEICKNNPAIKQIIESNYNLLIQDISKLK